MGVDLASVARRYVQELWAKGNLGVVDELVADDIELKDPMTPHGLRGKSTLRERVAEMTQVFSDRESIIQEVIVAGDRVVVRHTWRGKHTGTFWGLEPTGKYVSCLTSEILRMRDGLVVENISYYDVYEMFQQLGLLPPPDELARTHAATSGAHLQTVHRPVDAQT